MSLFLSIVLDSIFYLNCYWMVTGARGTKRKAENFKDDEYFISSIPSNHVRSSWIVSLELTTYMWWILGSYSLSIIWFFFSILRLVWQSDLMKALDQIGRRFINVSVCSYFICYLFNACIFIFLKKHILLLLLILVDQLVFKLLSDFWTPPHLSD